MIYYFSGTGNSKWVAEELAKNLDDKVVNIMDIDRDINRVVRENEIIGFVFPIYAWAAIEIMKDFMTKFTFEKGVFSFAVCTCGSEAGNTFKALRKSIRLNSTYSIVMPNNYVIGSKLDSKEVQAKKIKNAKDEINRISVEVIDKENVDRVKKGLFPALKTSLVSVSFNKYARGTENFYVEDTCVGCGFCAKICPSNSIKLIDGKPIWNSDCLQCLACINYCHQEAIQYGKGTKKKGRYYFGK